VKSCVRGLVEDFDGGAEECAGAGGSRLAVIPDEDAIDPNFFYAGGKRGGIGVGGIVDDRVGVEED
jgi:hypothetical protein